MARELVALPVRMSAEGIEIAVSDPRDAAVLEALREATGMNVRLLVAPRSDIEQALERSYKNTAMVDNAVRAFESMQSALEPEDANLRPATTVKANAPIVQVVNLILEQAIRDRASDVHIEPEEDSVRVRNRTDGALREVLTLPAAMAIPLVSRIKVMADMNIVERRRPQDGQFATSVAGRDLDVRVATAPNIHGEKCVMRLLIKSRALLQLGELGMPDDTATRFKKLVNSPYGMVICAGPTGSGKTTTLYATLSEINSPEINITTIEDPVEYVFPHINQMQINAQAGVTFVDGLRSILRQDPDAILVGEIRDVDTARIAVQSALTGHFVMSSLHATDSVAALNRFIDMGIEPFLIASSLLGIVAQRLVRRTCPECKVPYEPTTEELAFYEAADGPEGAEFVRGEGCNFCGNTGYFERVGVYEVHARHRQHPPPDHRPCLQRRDPCDRHQGRHAIARQRGGAARRRRHDDHQRSAPHDLRIRYRGLNMATFKYTAVTPEGLRVRAAVEAPSAGALRNELSLNDYQVLKVKQKVALKDIEITKQRVPRQVVIHFSRQLAAFVRAGIPLTDALNIVENGTENKRFRAVLAEVAESLRNGRTLSEALQSHEGIFPPYYLGIIRSAEQTGQLDIVLTQLSQYMERDLESSQRLKSALAYPAVIAVAAIGVVTLMATFVLPHLLKFFKQFGVQKPPLSARILLAVSDFFKHDWFVTPIVLVLAILLVMWMRTTPKGKLTRDRLVPAPVGHRRHHALRGGRALLPHHRRDARGRRAATGVDAGGDRQREQLGVRAQARSGERSAARGCRHGGDRSRRRTCSRSRPCR